MISTEKKVTTKRTTLTQFDRQILERKSKRISNFSSRKPVRKKEIHKTSCEERPISAHVGMRSQQLFRRGWWEVCSCPVEGKQFYRFQQQSR